MADENVAGYSAEQLKAAARRALAANKPESAKRLIEAAKVAESSRAPIRAGAQGLSFGFSDEAIAAATNPLSAAGMAFGGEGKDFKERLAAERKALEDYRRDYPVESIAAELGGAAIPAITASFLTGGVAAPLAAESLIARGLAAAPRLVKEGAMFGGLYGAGTAEGGLGDRLVGGLTGAAGGAIMGPIAGAATYPLAAGASMAVDAARRQFGGRAGKAVEAELQRLAEGTGLTTDEIVARIASGEIMAENQTLRMAVRGLMSKGGQGETMVRQTFDRRPPQTRQAAMEEIQKYLADTQDPNVLRGVAMTREQALQGERDAYKRIFAGGGPAVPTDVRLALADAFERVPSAGKELAAYTRAQTKTDPFFVVRDDGAVIFTRDPTTQEAEIARRFLKGKADEAYRGGSPWGEVFKDIEQGVRGPLDVAVPELAATRAKWADIKTVQDAFETGQGIFNRTADEVEILVEDLMKKGAAGQAQLDALRNGAMDALRAKARGAGGTSLMGTLTNPERKESAILRALLPPDAYDDIAQKMGVAAQAQAARGDIVKGPSTALVQEVNKRLGADINMGDIAAAISPNPVGAIQLGVKLAKAMAPNLTDKQRVQMLQVLLSEDPAVVRKALVDESGLMAFKNAVDRLLARTQSGVRGAAAVGGAMATGEVARQIGVQ